MISIGSTENLIVFTDYFHCCLRIFSRKELTTSQFAGKCTDCGDQDGSRLNVKLDRIFSLLFDVTSNYIYLSETKTGKIKKLSVESGEVTTVFSSNLLLTGHLLGLSKVSPGDDEFLFGALNGIFRFSHTNIEQIVPSSANNIFLKLLSLSPHLFLLVADDKTSVRLYDFRTNSSEIVCMREQAPSEDNILNCSAVQNFRQLTSIKESVYMISANKDEIGLNILTGEHK